MVGVWYNEFDPFAAQWLRVLIGAGELPEGEVDDRSILDVRPADLGSFRQCHFFAGIGGWPYALTLAGWPEDREVWTASLPCQPFSVAGKQEGFDDERDVWPVFFRLVRQCRPAIIFGEQVSAACAIVGENEDLQAVRDREAVFRVLRECEGVDPSFLQGLRKRGRAVEEARQPIANGDETTELEVELPGPCTDECGEASGEGERSAVRPRPRRHPAEDRRGGLRIDWDSLLSGHAESVERAVAGSDQSGQGIHERERQGGSVRPQRHGEHLGRAEDFGDCVGDFSQAEFSERAFASLIDEGVDAANFTSWLSRVFSDLDGAGYAVGWAIIPACAVGAPHRRERLYWCAVANANDNGGQHRSYARAMGTAQCRSESGEPKTRILGEAACDSGDGGGMADAASARERRDVDGGLGTSQRLAKGAQSEFGREAKGALANSERGGMADADGPEWRTHAEEWSDVGDWDNTGWTETNRRCDMGCPTGFWDGAEWLVGADGKARRVKPGVRLLVAGVSGRVGLLRGFGNSIVPQVGAAFVQAVMEIV